VLIYPHTYIPTYIITVTAILAPLYYIIGASKKLCNFPFTATTLLVGYKKDDGLSVVTI